MTTRRDEVASFKSKSGKEITVEKVSTDAGLVGAVVTLSTLGIVDPNKAEYVVTEGGSTKRFSSHDDAIDYASDRAKK